MDPPVQHEDPNLNRTMDEAPVPAPKNEEMAILNNLLEHTKENRMVKLFADVYARLVLDFVNAELNESVKRYGSQAVYLTGLSGIASFLASLEIGFVALIESPNCGMDPLPDGCSPHSRLLRAVITFFSYFAISCDALSALFALLIARSFLQIGREGQDLVEDKFKLDAAIREQQTRTAGVELRLWWILREQARDLDSQLASYSYSVDGRTRGQYTVISLILVGMATFFTALILQVITTQPAVFWIPFVTVVGTMANYLGQNTARVQYYDFKPVVLEWVWLARGHLLRARFKVRWVWVWARHHLRGPRDPEAGQLRVVRDSEAGERVLPEHVGILNKNISDLRPHLSDPLLARGVIDFFTTIALERDLPHKTFDVEFMRLICHQLESEDWHIKQAIVKFFTVAATENKLHDEFFDAENVVDAILLGLKSDLNVATIEFFTAASQSASNHWAFTESAISGLQECMQDENVEEAMIKLLTSVVFEAALRKKILNKGTIIWELSHWLAHRKPSIRQAVVELLTIASFYRDFQFFFT
ncbi:hypothetical protein DFH09DRAFT_590082 [Mycena vulgaris]|nr:hypothetical protein DFH09DRAFT_590082 [Mycena vulgaris]